MSAGDVKFIGWTGGSIRYRELAPQIQYEPTTTPGFYQKRVTINRVCFDRDKPSVISNFPLLNASLTSTYVDENGAEQTVGLGGGYSLLSISDAPISKGFSRVSAQYTKTDSSVFELGLPLGFSVDQVNGVCRIKYLTHVLEEFDSGTGINGSGLRIQIDQDVPITPSSSAITVKSGGGLALTQTYLPAPPDVNPQYPETSLYRQFLIYQSGFKTEFAPWLDNFSENANALAASIYCNDVKFDSIGISFAQIGARQDEAILVNTLTDQYFFNSKQQAIEAAETIYGLTNYDINESFAFIIAITSSQGGTAIEKYIDEDGNESFIYWIVDRSKKTYYDTRNLNVSNLYPRWESIGNVHRIMVGNLAWREYDVSGLV
jgi:hypothetical protein